MYFDENILFIHIPKAGGSSIAGFLYNLFERKGFLSGKHDHTTKLPPSAVGHETLSEAISRSDDIGLDINNIQFAFVCIRNPFELVLSNYFWARKRAQNICSKFFSKAGRLPDIENDDHEALVLKTLSTSFREFVLGAKHGSKESLDWVLRRPQEEWFLVGDSKPDYMKIIIFDKIESDTRNLVSLVDDRALDFPFPHLKKSSHSAWGNYFDYDMMKEIVERHRYVFDNGYFFNPLNGD